MPTTAGMPYSRATIAACDIAPPISDTAALIFPNTGAPLGAVTGQTRISPSLDLADLVDVVQHPRDAFDDAGRRGEPVHSAVGRVRSLQPRV